MACVCRSEALAWVEKFGNHASDARVPPLADQHAELRMPSTVNRFQRQCLNKLSPSGCALDRERFHRQAIRARGRVRQSSPRQISTAKRVRLVPFSGFRVDSPFPTAAVSTTPNNDAASWRDLTHVWGLRTQLLRRGLATEVNRLHAVIRHYQVTASETRSRQV